MIWLKSGSSQAMTIEFGVAQFGRFGVVFVALFRFVCQWGFPVGVQNWVSAFRFCCWKRCKSCLLAQVFQHTINISYLVCNFDTPSLVKDLLARFCGHAHAFLPARFRRRVSVGAL